MTQAEMSDAISGELAFDVFASESPVAHKQKALKALMREKLIPKQADDARFQAGLASLTRLAADRSEEPESRLLAIACVVHSAQVVKRLQPSLRQWLAPAMDGDFPALQLLKEADDRLNAARALSTFISPKPAPTTSAKQIPPRISVCFTSRLQSVS